LGYYRYRLLEAPQLGNLFRYDASPSSSSSGGGRGARRRLSAGATFTQADVDASRVVYRLAELPETAVRDEFRLRVSVPGAAETTAAAAATATTFAVEYEPQGGDLWVVNEGLTDVPEGGWKAIGAADLWVERRGVTAVEFEVVEGPRHGVIQLVGPTDTDNVTRSAAART